MGIVIRPEKLPLTAADREWRAVCQEVTARERQAEIQRKYIDSTSTSTRAEIEAFRHNTNRCGYVERFTAGGPVCQYNTCAQCHSKEAPC